MKIKKWIIGVIGISLLPLFLAGDSPAKADAIPNTDFEDNSLSSWNKGSQSGSFTNTITGNGTGVTLFSGDVVFNAPSHNAVGSPTLTDGSPNPYYAPAVQQTTWKFSSYGTYGVALQPAGAVSFNSATEALGLTSAQNQAIKALLVQQQQASGLGNPNPTNAAWITKNVTLSAGVTYTMSWNYIGTDYVPFNDGSITSLVPVTGTDSVIVNNQNNNYALLGFTNPGTGDYSTGTYGSTGWQISTYKVSQTGEYILGFAVFNLGDTALSPVLLVDNQPGSTLKNDEEFGAVTPNNPDAPTLPPATEPPATEPPATEPPATEPPATEPPATEPPATEPPATDAPVDTDPTTTDTPVETDPPTTDAPVETDPPATDAPVETDPPTVEETTTTTIKIDRPTTTIETTTTVPCLECLETTTTTINNNTVTTINNPEIINNPELPKTGSDSSLSVVALWLSLIGLFILICKRLIKA